MAHATAASKPMHHHHMGKMGKNHMQGPKTKSKPAGDPDTAQLNEQSLNAARGSGPAVGSQSGAMAPASSGAMAPGTGTMAPAGSGTPASAMPTNAPGGQ